MKKKKNKCRIRLVKKKNRLVGEDSPDRLSNLPDSILKHVLSFVDTVSAVQTSVLSRRWKYVWKRIPTLYFQSQYVNNIDTFVDKVLSLRDQPSKVDKIFFSAYKDDVDRDLYGRVVEYAVSHHAQLLHFDLAQCCVGFSHLFGSISCPDLKILRLDYLDDLDVGSCCFQTLTTLVLRDCWLNLEEEELDWSFSFPCLTDLSILRCSNEIPIKVYVPQLLTLKMENGNEDLSIEIIAPNLKFFRLKVEVCGNRGVPHFSIPHVDRAEILVKEYRSSVNESLDSDLALAFPSSRNAKSVVLRCTTSQTLKKMCKFLEGKLFRLPKLESLVCMSDEPYQVVNYQVQGSRSFKRFRRQ